MFIEAGFTLNPVFVCKNNQKTHPAHVQFVIFQRNGQFKLPNREW